MALRSLATLTLAAFTRLAVEFAVAFALMALVFLAAGAAAFVGFLFFDCFTGSLFC
jgi:hypothetical protein